MIQKMAAIHDLPQPHIRLCFRKLKHLRCGLRWDLSSEYLACNDTQELNGENFRVAYSDCHQGWVLKSYVVMIAIMSLTNNI